MSPFVDTIVGVVHNNATVSVAFSPVSEPVSVNDFGLAIGGGDFRISRLLSVRLRPVYYLANFESGFDSAFGFDAGLVLHFGH